MQVFAQQPTIKPALWQIDVTLTGNAADDPAGGYIAFMKSGMAAMTPEQRAQIENMLAVSGRSSYLPMTVSTSPLQQFQPFYASNTASLSTRDSIRN